MRKTGAIIITLILFFFLFGCANDQKFGVTAPDTNPAAVNPVHESTFEEILQKLGITIAVPEDAKDVHYSIIEIDGVNSIAQANFMIGNVNYSYRIQPAAALTDISGAHFEWTTVKEAEISYCGAELRYNEGQEGICLWYDTVPGLMYSLYSDSGASEESLMDLANKLFVPATDVP